MAEEARIAAEESPPLSEAEEPRPADRAQDRVLVVLDPDEEERHRLEGLEETLGHRVSPLDPSDFSLADVDLLAEARAVVVAWDLHGRPGLELVETLARDERLRSVPILLAADAPTRGMVKAALRAGAASFLMRPYDADEIRRRIPAG